MTGAARPSAPAPRTGGGGGHAGGGAVGVRWRITAAVQATAGGMAVTVADDSGGDIWRN